MGNVNEGHRGRLRERMLKDGLHGFQDHEILELLLFQYLPRHDTNKIAHNLLDTFGSFSGVFNATPEQLMTVDGISKVTACNIAMLKEVWHRYEADNSKGIVLDSVKNIVKYAQTLMNGCYTEKFVAVYIDNATKFMFKEEYDSNSTMEVHLDNKKIVTSAMRSNAAGVIIFHYHIKGKCKPSENDYIFTSKLFNALASLNIVLLEHIIFNDKGEFYSFEENKDLLRCAEKYNESIKK